MSVHGQFHRIFSDEQERNLTEHITEVYTETGRYFPDFAIQSLAFEFDEEIYRDNPAPPINCNAVFINDFNKRNNFSSRLAHFRQRPITQMQRSVYFLQKSWEELPASTLKNACDLYL